MSVGAALVELELARADYLTRLDELDAERAATVTLLDRCEDAIAAVERLVNTLDTHDEVAALTAERDAAAEDAAKWKALAERLGEALRLTQEYVGDDLLPPLPGWSWFDALAALDEARQT